MTMTPETNQKGGGIMQCEYICLSFRIRLPHLESERFKPNRSACTYKNDDTTIIARICTVEVEAMPEGDA